MLATALPQHADGFAGHDMQSSYFSMQGARPNPLDLSNATPRRMPKLAVRNRAVAEDVAVNDASQSGEESYGEFNPASPDEWPSSSVHRTSSRPITKGEQRHHQRHDSKDSNASDRQSRGRHPKRKSAGVLNFLTLKEPSTSALDQFAEMERRKAAQKGAKSVAAVMPGVSSQKIPDYVPKVNSKWDGLPEGARRPSVDIRDQDRMKRSSIISIGSASRGHSPRRLYGSISSKPSARQSHEKKRSTVQVTEVLEDRPTSSRNLHSPPLPAATHPALRTSNQQTFLHSPSRYPNGRTEQSSTTPEIELPELPSLQDRDYSSGTFTSPDASPRTPAFDATLSAGAKNGRLQPIPRQLDLNQAGTFWLSDSDDVVVKTAGPDVLHPPTGLGKLGVNRSPAKPGTARAAPERLDQSTFRPLSTAGEDPRPSMVRNFSHVSKYSGTSSATASTPPVQSPNFSAVASADSTRPTTMQSSVAPADRGKSMSPPIRMPSDSSTVSSNLSAQWASPSKDRLSLGPQIKKSEVLPWEMFDPPPEKRSTTKTTAVGDSSKLKRLSHRLGRK